MNIMKQIYQYKKIEILLFSILFVFLCSVNIFSQEEENKLDIAYDYLNSGRIDLAKNIFEDYNSKNPYDTRIALQLAYIYKEEGNYNKAFEFFKFVERKSKETNEVETAKLEITNLAEIQKNEQLNKGYDYLETGDYASAQKIFESALKKTPQDPKLNLQLAYIYLNQENYKKALEYFDYAKKYSKDEKDINLAENELKNIYKIRPDLKPQSDLNAAYAYLNQGDLDKAADIFETYASKNRKDTKIYLQLAYLYDKKKNYNKSLKYFEYVASNSKDASEIDRSKQSIYILKQMIPLKAKGSIDLYFYNIYDTYQENYISNFLGHLQYQLFENFYTGIYTDLYLDSKSKPELIYNDRYIEGGLFMKYTIANLIMLELRGGYVREIDLKKHQANFKPIISIGHRFGNPKFYYGLTSTKKDYFFVDFYATGLYDHKFRNFFGQVDIKETLRYLLTGYSHLDFYLGQFFQGDSKRFDYNNYGEFRVGLGYRPNLISFPMIFIEGSNKFYFVGNIKNSFQIKAGFLLTFNSAL